MVRTAVSNPNLYRYGSNVFVKAIENLASGSTVRYQDCLNGVTKREVTQLIRELNYQYELDLKRADLELS